MIIPTAGPAYKAPEGGDKLVVPTLNYEGRIVSSKTVHATPRVDLSISRSVWQSDDGTLYHLIEKSCIIH